MGETRQTHRSVMTLMDTFLVQADLQEKQGSNLDLAGDAKSTHPSANVDDKTKPAQEGARSSENEADVRKSVPDTINDESSKNTEGTEGATVNGDQGTTTMASDSGLKGNVDTPKKDHSQSMSDSGPGDGSETFKGDWDKASAASKLMGEANGLLADLAVTLKAAGEEMPAADAGDAAPTEGKADAAPVVDATPAESQPASEDKASSEVVELYKTAAEQYPGDVEAGYTAAALLAQHLGMLKDASADDDAAAVKMIRKEAAADAKNYVEFLKGFAEAVQKNAQPLGGMGGDPAALAALSGGAGGMGAGDMGAGGMGAGGMEEGGEMGGEEAGLEGLMGGGGGEGGEEGGSEEIIEALAEALDEAGVSPEDLAQAVAEAQGGEGGEMGAEGGELGAEGAELGAEGAGLGGEEAAAGAEEVMKPASATKPATKQAANKGSNRATLKAAVSQYFNG